MEYLSQLSGRDDTAKGTATRIGYLPKHDGCHALLAKPMAG
jgi:hypothetical protein